MRGQVQHTLVHAEPQPQASENTSQLERSLQVQMTNLREENHIALTNLDSKVEQFSKSFQSMGQTFQVHADSVHTEVLRLQSVF